MSILKKIEIKGLWGTTDIEWELDPHVNILGGINGSGKSTILNVVSNSLYKKNSKVYFPTPIFQQLFFKTDKECYLVEFLDGIQNQEEDKKRLESLNYENVDDIILEQKQKNISFEKLRSIESKIHNQGTKYSMKEYLTDIFKTQYISTFEQSLADVNAVKKVYGEEVETNLDFELAKLAKDYTNYRLNLSQKIQAVLDVDAENTNYKELHEETYKFKKRFEEIVNLLFVETNKQLIYENETNKLLFLKDNEKVTVYQLSSGEKQLLIILLSVLIQDNKESIILMDEPEVSLHIDWQKKLIGYIRELNPNAQLIIVTHSPGLIMEKWIDNVTEISEISKRTKGE